MSTKYIIASTLSAIFLLNGVAGAATQNAAKDTKKHDKQPPIAVSVASTQRSVEKKKDDKKQELVASNERSVEKKKDDKKKQELVFANDLTLAKLTTSRHCRNHRYHRSMIEA